MSDSINADTAGDAMHIVSVPHLDAESAKRFVAAALSLNRPGLSVVATSPEVRILVDRGGILDLLDALAAPQVTVHSQVNDSVHPPESFPEVANADQYAAHLDLALDSGGLGLWHWDLRTDEVAWSRQLETIHGMEPGSFAGTFAAFSATLHPDDRESVIAGVAQVVETGRDLSNHYRFVRSDGSTGWMRGSGRLLVGADGEPTLLVGVAIDETVERQQRDQIAMQLEELREATEERALVASLLHQTLLPPDELACPAGLIVDAAYVSAASEATGDFYDLFPAAANDEWILTIGDIAGHGPEASILTGSVRRSLQSAAALTSDPSMILQAANRVHLASGYGLRFATVHAVLLRKNPDASIDALVATAGHPPLLIVRDGSTEWHAGSGPPLGVVTDAEFESTKIRLNPGDSLVAYTDGITEAGAGHTDLFGEQRLQRYIEDTDRPSAQGLLSASQAHAGHSRQRDDAAAVIVTIA